MDRHPLSSSPPSSSPSPLSFSSSSWPYEDNEQFDRARGGYPREEKTKANLYKTELCRSFEETRSCKYGGKCQFAHGKEELRVTNRHPRFKTEICKTFHTTGTCPYGIRCRFIHMNGIPKCWEASYPLNYLILHEDRGSQELPSVSQLDGFLKQLLDILEGVNYDPEYAPEYAYLAKFMLHGTPILGRDDLVNIHQQVAASYPKYRLPIFESVASKPSENRFGVSSLFGPHYRDEVGRRGTANQTTA